MTNENNMTERRARIQRRVPGFDPTRFVQEVDRDGKKALTMPLEHKKAWFRLACPSGGVVLNALRVTDQMAIFEARLFADTEDRNPLASFTATRRADKTGQYIRAAQEDALDEALENAGFSLRLYELEQAGGTQTGQKAPTPDATPPVEDAPPAAAPKQAVQPVPERKPPVTTPKRTTNPAQAEQTPATTPGQTAQAERKNTPVQRTEQSKPAADSEPVADPASSPVVEKKAPASTVVDIATGQPVAVTQQTEPVQIGQTSGGGAIADDMTIEEICQIMTLEQAKAVIVKDGTCKGWTLAQVAADRPASLKWLRFAAPFGGNILKAAAQLVLNDLELKAAG